MLIKNKALWEEVKRGFLFPFTISFFLVSGFFYFFNLQSPLLSSGPVFLLGIALLSISTAVMISTKEKNDHVAAQRFKRITVLFFFIFFEITIIGSYFQFNSDSKWYWLLSVISISLGILSVWLYRGRNSYIAPRLEKEIKSVWQLFATKVRNSLKSYKSIELLILVIVLCGSFLFATADLGKFMTRDEPRWINYFQGNIVSPLNIMQSSNASFVNQSYARSVSYWNSYFSGNIVGTLGIDGGTGVATSILELPSYFFQNSPIEKYLFISRIAFVLTNLALALICLLLLKKLSSNLQSILFFCLLVLNPIFLGFSRIVNHDSITGTLVITALLFILVGIKKNHKKYFILGGCVYAFSALTSGKAEFMVPLFWLLPMIYSLVSREVLDAQRLRSNLFYFFGTAFVTFILCLPATIFYPEIALEKLILPSGLLLAPCLVFLLMGSIEKFDTYQRALIDFLSRHTNTIVRIFIAAMVLICFYVVKNLSSLILSGALSENSLPFRIAFGGTMIYFLYSLPLVVLVLLVIWFGYYFWRPKFDLSTVFMMSFFGLLLFSIVATYSKSIYGASVPQSSSFLVIYKKYLMILFPMFVIGLSTSEMWLKLKYRFSLCLVVIIVLSLAFVDTLIKPNYVLFSNELFPQNQMLFPYSWGIGVYQAANYLNGIASSSQAEITVFDPYGTGDRFFGSGVVLVGSAPKASYIISNTYAPGSVVNGGSSAELIQGKTPIWSYRIDNFNVISVFKI